jgi:hypothetical protein
MLVIYVIPHGIRFYLTVAHSNLDSLATFYNLNVLVCTEARVLSALSYFIAIILALRPFTTSVWC